MSSLSEQQEEAERLADITASETDDRLSQTTCQTAKAKACLLCKESFEDTDYFARGMCKTCYFKYKRLCRQNPDLAA